LNDRPTETVLFIVKFFECDISDSMRRPTCGL